MKTEPSVFYFCSKKSITAAGQEEGDEGSFFPFKITKIMLLHLFRLSALLFRSWKFFSFQYSNVEGTVVMMFKVSVLYLLTKN